MQQQLTLLEFPEEPLRPNARRLSNRARARLARLGRRTARRRARRDGRLHRAIRRYLDSQARIRHDEGARDGAITAEQRTAAAASGAPETATAEDQGRRGLSNQAYAALLAVVWLINLPIAVVTFQIFEEPMAFTVLLALVADVVLLCAAHQAGVTLRRSHLTADGWTALGVELVLGWALFGLGVVASFAQAWARWRYLTATGSGNTVGIVFSTILMLLTFLAAVWGAWRHHHPQVAERDSAAKRRRRLDRVVLVTDQRRVHRAVNALRTAGNRRRHLAQRNVGRADAILAHLDDVAATHQTSLVVDEPDWLIQERAVARTSMDGQMIQALDAAPRDVLPQIAATAVRSAADGREAGEAV